MILLLIILALLCLWKVRIGKFHENYCDPQPTTAIKGVLAVIILLSHIRGYIQLQPTLPNQLFLQFLTYLDQSMVALYFFYSGYGIRESLKHKPNYREHFLKNRWLKTLFHFDLAVALYVIASFIPPAAMSYPIKNYFLCWIGWEGVGNSNWFMFAILSLYLLAFMAMWIRKGWMSLKVLLPTVLLWVFLYKTHGGLHWWYDTLLTFPLGMLFSDIKPQWDQTMRKPLIWWATFLGLFIAYIGLHHLIGVDRWGIVSCLFCLIIVMGSMKVQIGNPVLKWLGVNAFAIYILQRLPMNLMSSWDLNQNLLLFVPCTLLITFLLAEGFTKLTGVLDKKLFRRA